LKKECEGLKIGSNEMEISYLQFANNTILFLQEDEGNLRNVIFLLQVFEVVSGLRINRAKCGVTDINIGDSDEDRLAMLVRCEVLSQPLTYLGMFLGGNPRTISFREAVLK